MPDLLTDIQKSFRLTETADGRLTGPNVPLPGYQRIFGGQMLGQALAAAAHTAPGKQIKSIHMVFLAEGDPAQPITYDVDAPHTGRSFASRVISGTQVSATRGERRLLSATVLLHAEEDGLDHQIPAPGVPGPEELTAGPAAGPLPVETRIAGDGDLSGLDVGEPRMNLWLRTCGKVNGDPLVHQGLLAYCSDSPMMGTALRPHPGLGLGASDRMRSAVVSHSIWFHRPFRADEWLLFSNESPCAHGGRVFGRGDWFTEDGTLVASCAQEGMVRVLDESPRLGS